MDYTEYRSLQEAASPKVMNYATLKEHLHRDVVKLIFRKADGTYREMEATLNPDLIPPPVPKVNPRAGLTVSQLAELPAEKSRNISDANVRVFDTVNQSWRSFVRTRLIEVYNRDSERWEWFDEYDRADHDEGYED
jgi:hypothetical protein